MYVKVFFRHPRPEYNSIEEVFQTIMQAFPDGVTFERVVLPYSGASLKSILGNLRYARRHRGKINHITGDVHYVALATGGNTVLTIHDVNSILNGSLIRRFLIKVLWFWLPAWCVKRITVISPKSADEVGEVISFFKRKIRVVPNPYNPRVGVGSRQLAVGSETLAVGSRQLVVDRGQGSGLSGQNAGNRHWAKGDRKKVVLLVGTKVNKNLERTLKALDSERVSLIVLGKLSEEQKRMLDHGGFEYESIFNVPYVEVAELYHKADLVCFASTYEGFGMPILEAQLAGRPIVTSNIDPMKWVAGEGARLVDPYSVEDIRRGVTHLLEDDHYREEIVRMGRENVVRFEPRVIAEMYCRVYEEEVVGSKQ